LQLDRNAYNRIVVIIISLFALRTDYQTSISQYCTVFISFVIPFIHEIITVDVGLLPWLALRSVATLTSVSFQQI